MQVPPFPAFRQQPCSVVQMNILRIVILAFFTLTFCQTSSAGIVYNLDYNAPTAPFNPNFDQADPTGISTKSYTAGTGLDGTRALQVDFDTTSDPFSVSYFTNLSNSAVDTPTSTVLSDYTLSFDVRIEGFEPGTSDVFTQFDLTLNDVNYRGILNSSASYQTVSSTLNLLTETAGGSFDLGDFAAGTRQFRVGFLGLNGRFGTDTDNVYFIDNISLTQTLVAVPEPSSFAYFSVACVCGLFRRRYSASKR